MTTNTWTIIGVVIAALSLIAYLVFTFFPFSEPTKFFAPQTMEDSFGGTQIQGDNNVVNKISTYVWSNKDTWRETLMKAPIPMSESEQEYNKVLLQFDTTGSEIITPSVCITLSTKTQIQAIYPEGVWYGPGNLIKNHPNYGFCYKTNGEKKVTIGIYSNQIYQSIENVLITN